MVLLKTLFSRAPKPTPPSLFDVETRLMTLEGAESSRGRQKNFFFQYHNWIKRCTQWNWKRHTNWKKKILNQKTNSKLSLSCAVEGSQLFLKSPHTSLYGMFWSFPYSFTFSFCNSFSIRQIKNPFLYMYEVS